ncbi:MULTISPECIES: hypothetical protein [unclassified Haematospirillum]|uniref:hypothetical protein n=1 Tax=unclassified Haematospirillum TaxID=2622088 RepID=UPI001438C76D|nr:MULTISPECIES: hypothetical protein [unclassified Haematospirillum]NKD56000.1 hypothetical protein [Haematospirillum sp. H4890]NKD76021.1 hypothetical protein [Haematospirillum sp. H4485]
MSGQVFQGIGDLGVEFGIGEGDVRKVLVHAAAGCGIGAATSGSCLAGAVGAGLQELASPVLDGLSDNAWMRVQLAGLAGAAATMLTGASAKEVQTAARIASLARANNRELHPDQARVLGERGARELFSADYRAPLGQGVLQSLNPDNPVSVQDQVLQQRMQQAGLTSENMIVAGAVAVGGAAVRGAEKAFAPVARAIGRTADDILASAPVQAMGNSARKLAGDIGEKAGRALDRVAEKVGLGSLKPATAGGVNPKALTRTNPDASVAKTDPALGRKFGPHEMGPLGNPNDSRFPASTFRSGTYTEKVSDRDLFLHRDYGGRAPADGRYWTLEPSAGPLQSQLESAILPEWGNTLEKKSVIKIPKGTKYYEGISAPQKGTTETRPELYGGGVQIFLQNPNKDWIVK